MKAMWYNKTLNGNTKIKDVNSGERKFSTIKDKFLLLKDVFKREVRMITKYDTTSAKKFLNFKK